MKLLEWLCNKANLSILKPRNPTKKVRSLIVVACCIALLAMLGCPVAEPGIQFVPNGDGVFTIGHIAHAPAADFVADGVDDHIQFQQALDALPTGGGKLIVLAGTYNFGAAVGRAIDNVTIQGIGQATVINRDGINPVFTAGAQSNWVFRDFKTDAGGIELTAAKNYTLQNITIGASYIAFRTDAAAEAWDIPIGRTATIVVAASNSSPQSKAQADFVADGVDDQVTIQAAIDALPAGGGKVLLLEGTFHIAATLTIARSNITLEGVGPTTIIRLKDGTITTPGTAFFILDIRGTSLAPLENIRVANFTIDGNRTNQLTPAGTLTADHAWPLPIKLGYTKNFIISDMVLLNGYVGIEPVHTSRGIISNNFIRNMIADSIGPALSEFLTITGNITEDCVQGIDIGPQTHHTTVTDNIIIIPESHILGITDTGGLGMTVRDSTQTLISNNTIKGTVAEGTKGIWILLVHSTDITEGAIVKGNTISNVMIGIEAMGDNHLIEGNIIKDSRIGIRLWTNFVSGRHIVISNNLLKNISDHGMILDGGAKHVVIQGNFLRNIGTAKHHFFSGIILFVGATDISVLDNTIISTEPANRLDAGITAGPNTSGRISGNNLAQAGSRVPINNAQPDKVVMFKNEMELFMDVLAASATHIHPAIIPDGLAHTDVTSPDVPRNAMIRITNTDTVNAQTPVGGNIVIEGMDARGRSVSETLAVPATSIPAGGTSDVFGSKAFAIVSKVTYYSETNTAITVSVGIANRIGLPACSSNFDGVFRVARNGVTEAVGAVDLLNSTVDLGTITTGDDFLIHYRVNLNTIR
ncbi:right-handed parallel beta-helix repeat-containing protein [Dehalococcoidia bacterium]|nr:right-handed parallel beta-helix repeat-containing protein [Dehalococcoidia bacterium]